MPGFELTDEELRVFLQEASEQLEILEQGLLRFEKDARNPALVQEIFRAAHTLKGGAGAAGFQEIERLTHVLESLLDEVRSGRRAVTVPLIDRMLEAVDALRQALVAIENDDAEGSAGLAAVRSRLEQLLAEEEQGCLVEWKVRVREDAPMPSIRLYQAQLILEEAGVLREVHPTAEMLEAEEHREMTALVLHEKPPEEVEAQLAALEDLEQVAWSPVSGGGGSAADQAGEQTGFGPEAGRIQPAGGVNGGAEEEQQPVLGNAGALSQTVRVDVALLDRLMNLVGELVTDRTRLQRLVSLDADAAALQEELEEVSSHLSRITTDLQESIMRARMIPLSTLFRKFPRLIRDASHQLGKEVDFAVSGEETELDRSVIEQIGDPLMHLLRNAVDHGLEGPEERLRKGKPVTGRVSLTAYHQENHIFIEVSDDGRGIDPQKVLDAALERGFVTHEAAQNLSESEILELLMARLFDGEGSERPVRPGVGLDVVRATSNGSMVSCRLRPGGRRHDVAYQTAADARHRAGPFGRAGRRRLRDPHIERHRGAAAVEGRGRGGPRLAFDPGAGPGDAAHRSGRYVGRRIPGGLAGGQTDAGRRVAGRACPDGSAGRPAPRRAGSRHQTARSDRWRRAGHLGRFDSRRRQRGAHRRRGGPDQRGETACHALSPESS